MKFSGVTLLLGVLVSSYAALTPVAEARTVVAFGDSTTATVKEHAVYSQLLDAELTRRLGTSVRVANAGVRGNTTAMAAARFRQDVLAAAPDLVVIQFGINDATIDVWKKPPATEPRVALADYRANLLRFVRELRARGAAVALMTPNPIEWRPKLVELYGHPPYDPQDPQGLNLNLVHYAAAVREIAATERVPLVDVWAVYQERIRAGQETLLPDGMHPNLAGHELVARLLGETIVRERLLDSPAK